MDRTNRVLQQLVRLIGRQRKAEEALLIERERLENCSDGESAIIYSRLPPDYSSLAFITDNVASNLGFAAEEWTSSGFWCRALHPEDAFEALAGLARPEETTTGHMRHVHEYRLLHKDGTWRWIRDESRAVVDKSGRLVQILGLWKDITEWRRIEDSLAAAANEFLKAVSESPMMIILASLEGEHRAEVNGTFQQITGYSRKEAVARFPSGLRQWFDRRDLRQAIGRMTAERKVRSIGVRFRTKHGRTLTGVLSAETVGLAGESCVLAVVGDIRACPSSPPVPARPVPGGKANNHCQSSPRIRLMRGGMYGRSMKVSGGRDFFTR